MILGGNPFPIQTYYSLPPMVSRYEHLLLGVEVLTSQGLLRYRRLAYMMHDDMRRFILQVKLVRLARRPQL
jgi:hypothetical protein